GTAAAARLVAHFDIRRDPGLVRDGALAIEDVRLARAIAFILPDGVGVARTVEGDRGIQLDAGAGVGVDLRAGARPHATDGVALGEVDVRVAIARVVPDEVLTAIV